jgi:hypothetical protein
VSFLSFFFFFFALSIFFNYLDNVYWLLAWNSEEFSTASGICICNGVDPIIFYLFVYCVVSPIAHLRMFTSYCLI